MAYNRINIDGLGVSETLLAAAAIAPGTVCTVSAGKFAAAAANAVGRLYIAGIADHVGGSITDNNAQDNSMVGYYMEEGREFIVRAAADTYTKDMMLSVDTGGLLKKNTDSKKVVAFAAEDKVLASAGLLRVRVRNITDNGYTG